MRKRSSWILPTGVSLMLIAFLAILAIWQVYDHATASSGNPAKAKTKVLNVDGQSIPLDPGVKVPPLSSSEDPAICTYDSTLKMADATAFYIAALERSGWVLAREGPLALSLNGWGISFVTGSDAPIRYTASLALSPLNNGGTNITLILGRWPDPNKVPIYPGASQVVSKSDIVAGTQYHQHEISFAAPGTSQDVAKYYRDILSNYGWKEDTTASGKLLFKYSNGGPEAMTLSNITIETKAIASKEVSVHIAIISTEFGSQSP